MLARLGRIPAASQSSGPATLAQAGQGVLARQAEAVRRASAHAAETDRRKASPNAAPISFALIADASLTTLTNAASSTEVRKVNRGERTVRIDDAQGLSRSCWSSPGTHAQVPMAKAWSGPARPRRSRQCRSTLQRPHACRGRRRGPWLLW